MNDTVTYYVRRRVPLGLVVFLETGDVRIDDFTSLSLHVDVRTLHDGGTGPHSTKSPELCRNCLQRVVPGLLDLEPWTTSDVSESSRVKSSSPVPSLDTFSDLGRNTTLLCRCVRQTNSPSFDLTHPRRVFSIRPTSVRRTLEQ